MNFGHPYYQFFDSHTVRPQFRNLQHVTDCCVPSRLYGYKNKYLLEKVWTFQKTLNDEQEARNVFKDEVAKLKDLVSAPAEFAAKLVELDIFWRLPNGVGTCQKRRCLVQTWKGWNLRTSSQRLMGSPSSLQYI